MRLHAVILLTLLASPANFAWGENPDELERLARHLAERKAGFEERVTKSRGGRAKEIETETLLLQGTLARRRYTASAEAAAYDLRAVLSEIERELDALLLRADFLPTLTKPLDPVFLPISAHTELFRRILSKFAADRADLDPMIVPEREIRSFLLALDEPVRRIERKRARLQPLLGMTSESTGIHAISAGLEKLAGSAREAITHWEREIRYVENRQVHRLSRLPEGPDSYLAVLRGTGKGVKNPPQSITGDLHNLLGNHLIELLYTSSEADEGEESRYVARNPELLEAAGGSSFLRYEKNGKLTFYRPSENPDLGDVFKQWSARQLDRSLRAKAPDLETRFQNAGFEFDFEKYPAGFHSSLERSLPEFLASIEVNRGILPVFRRSAGSDGISNDLIRLAELDLLRLVRDDAKFHSLFFALKGTGDNYLSLGKLGDYVVFLHEAGDPLTRMHLQSLVGYAAMASGEIEAPRMGAFLSYLRSESPEVLQNRLRELPRFLQRHGLEKLPGSQATYIGSFRGALDSVLEYGSVRVKVGTLDDHLMCPLRLN